MESVLVTVESDSGDEGDNGTPVTKETTPMALETLPFIMESNIDHSEASLQAFLDSGLPGYIPEMSEGAHPFLQQEENVQDLWSSDDDGDEVLDLIDVRKHWTTPTEELDTWDEQGNTTEPDSSLHVVPNTWASADKDGHTWSFSDAERLKHWQTYESKPFHDLQSRWADIDDHGNHLWTHQEDDEPSDKTRSHDTKRDLPHTWSLGHDLSALWTDNSGHIKGMAVDHNENPVNVEENAQSWPLQHNLGNYGNKHWLSAAEETIMYPSDWIVEEHHTTTEQHSVPQRELEHDISTRNNNNKLFHPTKHWSLGDQVDEKDLNTASIERHFSLQDSDLRNIQHWNPNNDDRDDIECLWIHAPDIEKASGPKVTDKSCHRNLELLQDISSDACIWSAGIEKTEQGTRPRWLSGNNDVSLTESTSDGQSPEVCISFHNYEMKSSFDERFLPN